MKKVHVDFGLCESNGVCMGIIPEVFHLDDQDFLHVLDDEVTPQNEHDIREAVRQCMTCSDQIELTCEFARMLRGNKGTLIVFVKCIDFDSSLDDDEHVDLTLAGTEDLGLCWDVFLSTVLANACHHLFCQERKRQFMGNRV